jgi:NAD(P)H-flavin reductase
MIIPFEAACTAKEQLTTDVYRYVWHTDTDMSTWRGGQYLLMICMQNSKRIYRAYSLSKIDRMTRTFECIVKHIPGGLGSEILAQLPLTGTATFLPPQGSFYPKTLPPRLVCVATGTGVAPFFALFDEFAHDTRGISEITLLWGVRTKKDLYEHQRFAYWSERMSTQGCTLRVYPCMSRDASDQHSIGTTIHGHVQDYIPSLVDHSQARWMLCGSTPMVKEVQSYLIKTGVPMSMIQAEAYG